MNFHKLSTNHKATLIFSTSEDCNFQNYPHSFLFIEHTSIPTYIPL